MPAVMRLTGWATWWAPRPLKALHDRFGLSEGEDPGRAPAREEPVPHPHPEPARPG